jgi:hypothetical protein
MGAVALALLLGVAGGGRLCAGQNPAELPSRIDPKARQILDRLIQILGGPAFLHMKRLTTRGRVYAIREGSASGFAPFESYVEYPDKRRFSFGKNPPVILINNGDQAWELDRYGQTSQLPEQARRWKISNRYSLENLLRLRIQEPGILVQPGGVDFVDNVATQALSMVDAQGTQLKLDLNRQTFLPVSITYRVRDPETGDWDDFADVYSDYKNIEGIITPMHIARFLNEERVSEIFRNSAHYDDEYPPTYFRPVQ